MAAMRIVEVAEGTAAWRAWRAGGLGASDAPALCGVSRYQDAATLWRRKRAGDVAPPPDNLRLARGRALEPAARAALEARLGAPVVPRCVEHDLHPQLRASLDGWCERLALPVEIKCPDRGLHAEALAGRVPRRFVPQALHTLLVTGAARLLYASYQPDGLPPDRALALVELPRDDDLCHRLQRLELDFWRSVLEGTAPPPAALPLHGVTGHRYAWLGRQ